MMMAMANDKVKVIITDSQKKVRIPTGLRMLVRRACIATLREEEFKGNAEVNVTFVDDEEIHSMNKQFRNIDSSTDVLSFPMGENGVYDTNPATGAKILGDVVISLERAAAQAAHARGKAQLEAQRQELQSARAELERQLKERRAAGV